MIKVYSGRPDQLESGVEPHLEATFKSDEMNKAKEFVQEWSRCYPNWDTIFWIEGDQFSNRPRTIDS